MLRAHLSKDPVWFEAQANGRDVSIYPLSLFDAIEIEGAWISAQVTGLTDVALAHAGGAIPAGKPFFLFGGAPPVGSYIDIYNPEIFAKRLDSLGVRIDWSNLPRHEDGFRGYYRDYSLDLAGRRTESLFDNRSFKIDLATVNPTLWDIPGDATGLHLFRTLSSGPRAVPDAASELDPTTVFDVRPLLPETPPSRYPRSRGAIRLTLAAPLEGFGDSVFAPNVLAAVTVSVVPAKQSRSQPPPAPPELRYPSIPWCPQATRITLSYTATGLVFGSAPPHVTDPGGGGAAMFHLLPFDGFHRLAASTADKLTLLPRFKQSGQLLLGLTGAASPERLTLLFHMAPPVDLAAVNLPAVQWERLSTHGWAPLSPSPGTADGTDNLRRSGVITFDLPAERAADSTVLDPAYRWIRASVDRGAEFLPDILGIHPNAALTLWRSVGNNGEHLARPLPAHTIQASLDKLPGVAKIDQPMPSFGGRPPETQATMPLRVGERLRHKERAVACWDYERLVLERFPAIDRVRTLPARNPRTGPAPGEVTVVVLPTREHFTGLDPTAPMVCPELLEEIRSSLAGSASPFITVHVVNPVYVRIAVHALVEFAAGEDCVTCEHRLNDALVSALSPWSLEAAWADEGLGHPSVDDIAELIWAQPYVTRLIDIKTVQTPDPGRVEWYFATTVKMHAIRCIDDLDGEGDP